MSEKDALSPSPQLLIKLGSAIVHADEFLSSSGHPYDKVAFDGLMQDPDVQEWLTEMDRWALIPKKR